MNEDYLVPISSLQHYLFCPRQCALIHLENIWQDNILTAEGTLMHQHVHEEGVETRKNVIRATSLKIQSTKFGIYGIADMVEFWKLLENEKEAELSSYAQLPGRCGYWKPVPIEYKHGKPKEHKADEVQLCAQALCLEEMLHVIIESGALFYGQPRRRTTVIFDENLRQLTIQTISLVRNLFIAENTPCPNYSKSCNACSVIDECHPKSMTSEISVKMWIKRNIREIE